jgi:hypothetical protein
MREKVFFMFEIEKSNRHEIQNLLISFHLPLGGNGTPFNATASKSIRRGVVSGACCLISRVILSPHSFLFCC